MSSNICHEPTLSSFRYPLLCTVRSVAVSYTHLVPGFADDHRGRLQIGTGLLYEQGMDLTVAYEHETRYLWGYYDNALIQISCISFTFLTVGILTKCKSEP